MTKREFGQLKNEHRKRERDISNDKTHAICVGFIPFSAGRMGQFSNFFVEDLRMISEF